MYYTAVPRWSVTPIKLFIMILTQEKSPAQIIFHIDTNNLVTNKDSNEIANEIVQLTKSAKTDKNKVAISSLAPRKDKCKSKRSKHFLETKM